MISFAQCIESENIVNIQGRKGRGAAGTWIQGQRVRAEEGELLREGQLAFETGVAELLRIRIQHFQIGLEMRV